MVSYNISKIEAILFFKICQPKLAKQIAKIKLKIDREIVFFNIKNYPIVKNLAK